MEKKEIQKIHKKLEGFVGGINHIKNKEALLRYFLHSLIEYYSEFEDDINGQ